MVKPTMHVAMTKSFEAGICQDGYVKPIRILNRNCSMIFPCQANLPIPSILQQSGWSETGEFLSTAWTPAGINVVWHTTRQQDLPFC